MKNFPIEHEGKIYWISRAVAVVGYIFCLDDKKLFVLANKRGSGTPDFQGYWNCPCGYLDFDETTAEACSREIMEETNLNVNPKSLILYGIEDNPSANRQNVTFRYYTFSDRYYKGQTVYAKGAEENEVSDVEWIPVENIDDYKWAFNHDKTIKEVVVNKLSDWISSELKSQFIKSLNN